MRKLLLLPFLAIQLVVYSQSAIRGELADSVEKKSLTNSVVSLLSEKDSVLLKFARVGKDGSFNIPAVPPGHYILMITHPYFGDYFDKVEVNGSSRELGKIYMTPKSKLLAEVIVKSGTPIRIKGDTVVYTADSFRVRPGANVEELLRRLPGIQVDRSGNITAMGERVKKVLVDGEEFFGSDPGIATKNLRADAVKEVEVFDKKSDQAEFTGIDDGVRDKTINLKMKKKEGYFGKIELGGGLKDKYDNSAMINSFSNSRKLAAYGIMSNTGQTNLDWQDAQNYGGGSDNMMSGMDEGGGMWISVSNDPEDSYWGGRNGIPTNWNGGLHYSNKFGKDKQGFNSGYKYSKVNSPGTTQTFARTFLPDSSWISNSLTKNNATTIKHAFNLTMDFNLDSMNSIKWTTRFNNRTSDTHTEFNTESLLENTNKDTLNSSERNSTNHGINNNATSSLLWKHKFKKLSRTLSINADLTWNESKNNGLLYSLNQYYDNGILAERDTIDQQNVRNNENKGINTKISYTEPLMKDTYLEFSYSLAWNSSSSERITSTKDQSSGKYDNVIDSLSNSFKFNRLVNTPGLNFRVNKKKYNYSFGASVGFSHFVQENLSLDTKTDYNYTNFFPRANFIYKFKPSVNLRFNYNGATNAPTLEQLQPIRVNTDPLNIYIGNTALKQSFRHTFSTGYNSYNVLKEKGIFANLFYGFTENAFVQSNQVDSVGKRIYQTINTNGVYNIQFFSSYSFKITKAKINIGLGPQGNINRNIDFINGMKNLTTTKSYGLRIDFSKYVDKKYNFHFGPAFTWNSSTASVNQSANAEYWQIEGWASARVNLPKNFEFNTDANMQIRQKDPRFSQNNNYVNLGANLTRRFLKENQLELKFGVYDILNQNRGYQRSFNSFNFNETYYTTLKRFWLLTVTWNLSKNGKPASF